MKKKHIIRSKVYFVYVFFCYCNYSIYLRWFEILCLFYFTYIKDKDIYSYKNKQTKQNKAIKKNVDEEVKLVTWDNSFQFFILTKK